MTTHYGRRLDARISDDPRNAEYPATALLPVEPPEPVRTTYDSVVTIDQGREGACVGFCYTQMILTEPSAGFIWSRRRHRRLSKRTFRQTFNRLKRRWARWISQDPERRTKRAKRRARVTASRAWAGRLNPWAQALYKQAQTLDSTPGEDYAGTSMQAGAAALRARGLITTYRWIERPQVDPGAMDALRDTLLSHGPVAACVSWYDGMYTTTKDLPWLAKIEGQPIALHAILIDGYDPDLLVGGTFYGDCFRWHNSWGTEYGVDGWAWIRREDLEQIFKQGCVVDPYPPEVQLF